MSQLNKDLFGKLVSDLSETDRISMLRHITSSTAPVVQLVESDSKHEEGEVSLKLKIQKETLFYRLILWLRSFFTKEPVEQIYNDDLINIFARKVSREHPGIINHKNFVLDYLLYERLKTLKEASDFFKPYFSSLKDNAGEFYVFLSSIITPVLDTEIKNVADPFKNSFSKDPSNELKNELVRSLEDVLKSIKPDIKAKLYGAITAVNWLRQFTTLPFMHFLAQFTNVSGTTYTCPYSNAISDYDAFAAVFANLYSVDNEVLGAIYLFHQKKEGSKNLTQAKDVENLAKEFISKANGYFSVIQMFLSAVPINRVGKIINNDFSWQSPNISGVENWFTSFKSQWKQIIDIRYNQWVRERKKNLMSHSLNLDFKLDEFPSMIHRPWNLLWMNVPFACELTGGFLSWFVENEFPSIEEYLNDVVVEGIFIKSDNRQEYSEALNVYTLACKRMMTLNKMLSPEGEYGLEFKDIAENKVRSSQVQNQINSMMSYTESEIREIILNYGKGARGLELIFKGIFDDVKDGYHDTLQNLANIKGRGNREWQQNLMIAREKIRKSMYYIAELEPIDDATKGK